MSQFGNGEVSRYLSADINVAPALSEGTVPSFPGYRTLYIEKDMFDSSTTSFSFWAANSCLQSSSNFTSDLCINNEPPNGKLSSESHITAISGCDTLLPSAHSSYYNDNPGYLRILYPKVSEEICWGEEPLPGVSEYSESIDVSEQRNVTVSLETQDTITVDHDTHLANQKDWFSSGSSGQFHENSASIDTADQRNVIVSPQILDTITVDHDTHLANQNDWFSSGSSGKFLENSASFDVSDQRNVIVSPQTQDTITVDHDSHLANQKEWFSSRSSGQFLENSGSGGSMLKAVNAITPSNYAYFHGQNNVSSPFSVDELCSDNSPSSDPAPTKSRMRWTPELHERFVDAVNKLGGSEKATPKAVQKIMKAEGLTIYHKYRTVCHRSESSDGTSTEISSQMDEVFSQNLKNMEASEGLRTQIGLQKQLHEQLEIQRKLQLQVEEHSKYLERVVAKQGESLKLLSALPKFQHASTPAVDHKDAYREQTGGSADLAEESHSGKK